MLSICSMMNGANWVISHSFRFHFVDVWLRDRESKFILFDLILLINWLKLTLSNYIYYYYRISYFLKDLRFIIIIFYSWIMHGETD